jgi:tetratricopeptide (TPR) repeat protein
VLRRIEALDPLNPILKGWNAWMLSSLDRNDEAIAEARRALELDPANPYAYLPLGDALRAKGQMEKAIEAYQHGRALGNRARAALASIYAAVGRRAEALTLLDSLQTDAKHRYVGADVIASVYASLGERDQAFRLLDRAVADHCGQLVFAGFDHRWDPLRGDPRFALLMRKLGLRVWRR